MVQIDAAKISEVLHKQLADFKPDLDIREVGKVIQVGDGIAHVSGLNEAMQGELLEFECEDGRVISGLALNLEEGEIGAVLMGDVDAVKENDTVRTTGRVVEVPCGKGLLGRIVDPLGNPLDGKGPIKADGYRRTWSA